MRHTAAIDTFETFRAPEDLGDPGVGEVEARRISEREIGA